MVLCHAELHDLLPSILPQLGADNMNTLRKLAEEGYGAGGAGFGRGPPGGVGTIEEEDEEDDGAYHMARIKIKRQRTKGCASARKRRGCLSILYGMTCSPN